MDYKYIEQLLERYWQCETSLQEEEILRAFFSQEDVPVWLLKYKALFSYQQAARQWQPLGDDFDARMMALTGEDSQVATPQEEGRKTTVKARTITLTHRLMPLFKAAAVVAIVLTLGNAAQAPWDRVWDDPEDVYARYHDQQADSLKELTPVQAENLPDSTQKAASPVGTKY
jgi:hypothetical protein